MQTVHHHVPKVESSCDLRLICFILGCYQILVTSAETFYQLNGINFNVSRLTERWLFLDLGCDAATLVLTIFLLGVLFSKWLKGVRLYLVLAQLLILFSMILAIVFFDSLKAEVYSLIDLACLCFTWLCTNWLHQQWTLLADLQNKPPKPSIVFAV